MVGRLLELGLLAIEGLLDFDMMVLVWSGSLGDRSPGTRREGRTPPALGLE